MIIQKMISYVTFRRQGTRRGDYNLKMMHGINRISILLFLFAVAVMVYRALSD